jgi:RecA/RadA recombinase
MAAAEEWFGRSALDLSTPPATPPSSGGSAPARGIVTFSQAVDVLLAGGRGGGVPLGVPLGRVTELVGAAGIGKTQMALQLALDVQLPAELGGCEGAAVYLDSEGGASPWRLRAMAAAVEAHMARFVEKRGNHPALRRACSVDALMANVLLARVATLGELLDAVTEKVPALLAGGGGGGGARALPVKLLVVDSVAFHYRYGALCGGGDAAGERARSLAGLGLALARLAERFGVAVVVTNHVTLRGEGGGTSAGAAWGGGAAEGGAGAAAAAAAALDPPTRRLCPALGEVWAHAASAQLLLKWERGRRVAVLARSLLAGGAAVAAAGGGPAAPLPPDARCGDSVLPAAGFAVCAEGVRGWPKKRGKRPAQAAA